MVLNKIKIVRYQPKKDYGLTEKQVKQRQEDNLINYNTDIKTKSIGQIIIINTFTLFNFINLGLGLAIFLVGSYKNLMFLGVVVCNTIISIIQEIYSKTVVDKLSIISATKVTAIRDGQQTQIGINDIVLDDIIEYSNGSQIVTDSIILEGSCEVDESFITGESNPISKEKGDMLLSGSFIISGKCIGKVEHIGLDNYTSSISKDAKYIKKVNSELMRSLKKIIKVISIIIIPIGILLFKQQISIENNSLESAVINTVAALIGMIPEGLILLTSTVLAVSVIRLAKYKVLVQELYCIETLARVDVICFDKTGTLTDGNMEIESIIPLQNKITNFDEILGAYARASVDSNPTMLSLKEKYKYKDSWEVNQVIPFSSKRKWSGINFTKTGSYILGAPEKLLKFVDKDIKEYLAKYRVLLLAHSKENFEDKELPNQMQPLALILMKDTIRKNAKKTLQYFKKQKVQIKILSGDSVHTVSAIARHLEFENYDNYIDASTINDDEALKEAAIKYDIFGRVSPEQKKIIIKALKENKHTVAMIGDGVNDVLALKEADSSIAIASGSDAARNVSEIVLLNSNFDAMPKVVKEGRRTINNITRSATLFIAKTSYATILAVLFMFINMQYPFEPIQLTLTSVLTIGIPSFVLAIEPNNERIKGNFLATVISKSLPTAFTIVLNIIIIMIISSFSNWTDDQTSTLSVILTGYTGFLLLFKLSSPFNLTRKILFIVMVLSFFTGILGLKELFSLTFISFYMFITIIILIIGATLIFKLMTDLYYKIRKIYYKKFLKTES